MTDTSNLGLHKPTAGDATWDVPLNQNADTLDALFAASGGTHDHSGAAGHGQKLSQANTHQSPDTDGAPTSLHHTLGTGANQAAAGNHTHTGYATTTHASAHAAAGSDPLTLTAAQISDFAAATGASIHAATAKTTPVDADETALIDSAASNALKRLTWANVKATLKTYFDTLYAAVTHTHAAADLASGTIAPARLGSGTADSTTILYGDSVYRTAPSGGGGGTGDASTNTSTSVDGEVALFSGTGGKTLKRATGSGLALLTSGVQSTVAAPSGAVVGTTDTQTLTNKTLTTPTITGLAADTTGKAARTDALNSATTVVNVSAATAPTSGQVLTATDSTHATWQTPSSAPVGFLPYALSLGLYAGATVAAGAATLPANGGTVLVPVAVEAPLLLASVTMHENSTTLSRGWEWRLYKDTGSNTLAEIAGANGSETFTATAGSNRTAAATTPPTLAAGAYWLALRCTDASNNLNLSGIAVGAGTAGFAGDGSQTKTLGTALGSTLDATAATWAKSSSIVAARLNGATFGLTTAF